MENRFYQAFSPRPVNGFAATVRAMPVMSSAEY